MSFGSVIKTPHKNEKKKRADINLVIFFICLQKAATILRQGFEKGSATTTLKFRNCLCIKFDCDIKVSFVEHKPNLFAI